MINFRHWNRLEINLDDNFSDITEAMYVGVGVLVRTNKCADASPNTVSMCFIPGAKLYVSGESKQLVVIGVNDFA